MEINKGFISDYDYADKYDEDGNKYRLFTITVDGIQYTSKAPKDVCLVDGAAIVYEFEGREIVTGYCPADNTKWGPKAGRLKSMVRPEEKYTFARGTITEKRKETSRVQTYSGTTGTTLETRVGFTVILGEVRFNASFQFGKDLKPGAEIAAVLENRSVVLLKDLKTGKYIGKEKPYFILVALFIIALNVGIPYIQQHYPDLLVNVTSIYVVFNTLLGIFLLIKIATYIHVNHAMKRMDIELAK